MKNNHIKQLSISISMGLLLSACGGSSDGNNNSNAGTATGGSTGNTSITPLTNKVKVPQCGNGADQGKAIAKDATGKNIQKLATDTKVRIFHTLNGSKLVCMIKGEAHILP